MNQLLRHLIVIINLIPGCLCFAQESANKTPSSPPDQKPKTELQRPNSEQAQNPHDALPGVLGVFLEAELPPETNSWSVQIISRGGLDGTGKGSLTITSQGRLVWNAAKNQCNSKLGDDVLQMLTQTAYSANATMWSDQTSKFCSDCYVTTIVLQRRERGGIGKTYIASWDDITAGKITDELRKVYDTFMTHKGCKQ